MICGGSLRVATFRQTHLHPQTQHNLRLQVNRSVLPKNRTLFPKILFSKPTTPVLLKGCPKRHCIQCEGRCSQVVKPSNDSVTRSAQTTSLSYHRTSRNDFKKSIVYLVLGFFIP